MARTLLILTGLLAFAGCAQQTTHDLIIRNGMIHDGSGEQPVRGDVAIDGDRIAAVGDLSDARGRREVDAGGLAVVPGFINMLSWANESLLIDGRSLSDIKQGVTLEVMGEGWSMGPLNEAMKAEVADRDGAYRYDVAWTTLGEYLEHLERRGVSCNVASFVGAATIRIHELGYADRAASRAELERMRRLVAAAMKEGALGLSTALIYTPGTYADTDEIVELATVAGQHGGIYISHLRNEANGVLEALEELITIARRANLPAEVYHLKTSGRSNWNKLDQVIARIEAARAAGLNITADMYTYHASSTGLNAIMPPWVQEGGYAAWVRRLKDPAIRKRVAREMNESDSDWDNTYTSAGSPDNILLVGFKSEALRPLIGKTLGEVARQRGSSPEETAMDLVIEDGSRVEAVFFTMSEDNVRRKIRQPWMSFCSDGGSYAAEGVFLERSTHPRAYGSFARLLGKYIRDEQLISLSEAVHRLTALPAGNLRLKDRGRLAAGCFADVVIFDPSAIRDVATFERPHQYAEGVVHVWVNGEQVLQDGEHTGATPGRVVRGPGWSGRSGWAGR